jgi:hypothetical protein
MGSVRAMSVKADVAGDRSHTFLLLARGAYHATPTYTRYFLRSRNFSQEGFRKKVLEREIW